MSMHMTSHLGAVTAGAVTLTLSLAGAAAPATARAVSPACRAPAATVYVANDDSGTVTPIRIATNKPGPAIPAGNHPLALVITPNGKTIYAASSAGVTPVNITSRTAGKTIPVAGGSQMLAITPNGKAVYVVPLSGSLVTPISTRTNQAGRPINVGPAGGLVITPDSRTVYVTADGGVVPIRTATNTAGAPIPAGGGDITITPNGKALYTIDTMAGLVWPIRTATSRAGRPIQIPVDLSRSPWFTPGQVLIVSRPDSRTVYAASPTADAVIPISTATNRASKPIKVGQFPYTMAITPDGRTLVVVNQDNTVTLINTAANRVTATIHIQTSPVWWTIQPLAISPDGRTAYVASDKLDMVTPISLPAGRTGRPITVGRDPVSLVSWPAPPAHR